MLKGRTKKMSTFVVMGDGPDLNSIKAYSEEKEVKTVFLGRLPYEEMCGVLVNCDIVVNPIIKGATQSIINKHADYAASGRPVVNTQECDEYRNLVEQYCMGLNCENGNSEDLANKLLQLIDNEDLRKEMGLNARKCAEECFDRRKSYLNLVDSIIN